VVELTNAGFEGMDYMRHDGLQMASMKAGIDGQRLTESAPGLAVRRVIQVTCISSSNSMVLNEGWWGRKEVPISTARMSDNCPRAALIGLHSSANNRKTR
jgi:hypothetical protein